MLCANVSHWRRQLLQLAEMLRTLSSYVMFHSQVRKHFHIEHKEKGACEY